MRKNQTHCLTSKRVCEVLFKSSLLTEEQTRMVLSKKDDLQRKLERLRAMRLASTSSKSRVLSPITIIDVIDSLKLDRADEPDRQLDEEAIYQALAQAWGIPFKKIDPLKLDLNLVTSTIPHSFAMKHLVLPIAIEGGCLTVATPNPFNVEVLEDIARATQLKVNPVVSTKSDVVTLIDEFFGF